MQVQISHTAKRLVFINGSMVLAVIFLLLINVHRLNNVYSRIGAVLVILLAAWAIYLEFRKTVLTDEGMRFSELMRFWRIRPTFVPWQDIRSIDPHMRSGQRYVAVHLTDGRKIVLSAPADLFDKPRFDRDLATIRQWHARYGRMSTPS